MRLIAAMLILISVVPVMCQDQPSSLDPAGVRGVRMVMREDRDLFAEGGSDRRRPFRIAEALVIPHRAWYRRGPTPGRWEA